jgi:septum formation protein
MALLLKGKTHNFYTGIAVVDDRGRQKTNVTKTEVTFKNFSNQILSDFVASKIWQGKAGGYDIAKDKTKLIDCFQGSYTNILGLPIKQLTSILSKFDVKIKNNLK